MRPLNTLYYRLHNVPVTLLTGSAYVYSPCGVAGGNPYGCPWEQEGINECPGGKYCLLIPQF